MNLDFLSAKDIAAFNKAKALSVPKVTPAPSGKETCDKTPQMEMHKVEPSNDKKEVPTEENTLGTDSTKHYPGDIIDETPSLHDDGYGTLDFSSPDELISFYDKNIANQVTILHPWQREVSKELAAAKPNQQKPHKFILCACNGSGKDAFVIAPFAIWFALTKIQSRCIITSSSGVQLTSQTESYITNLARKVNEFHGEEIFKIRQRYIKCRLSGSEIRLFATDEEGKAEGYHPLEPNSEMAIVINEGKSVVPEIYRALKRCTGYNYWIEVSTPGAPHGDFYTHFTTYPHARRIDTFMCSHLSDDERESDKKELGEHSALYRSKHLALFTSAEGDCIIPLEVVDRNFKMCQEGYIRASGLELRIGIDLAAGGDENACIAAQGNKIIKRLYFRDSDTTSTARRINHWLSEEVKVPKTHSLIFADDGGVGKGILDQLNSNYGWNIARILNQSVAGNKKMYINRGAENWYRVKRILEEHLWFFSSEDELDEKLKQQLSTRYYKQQSTQGRIALESKKEAKANGRPSPDRADAFILLFTGLTVEHFLNSKPATEEKKEPEKALKNVEDTNAWYEDKVTFAEYEGKAVATKSTGRKFYGSVTSLINRTINGNRN